LLLTVTLIETMIWKWRWRK